MITLLAAAITFQGLNTLTPAETKAGWKLLFDGQTTKGWHNFKSKTVGPGWTVKDGVLTSSDPHTAGDIVTDQKFTWFELELDFNMGKGENSGIIFHAADTGGAMWHTGPEIQLFDNPSNRKVQQAGWLYELYPATVDAYKPAGEWNHLRLVISKEKCSTFMNGVKYYDFVLGSDDFKARIAKSKFKNMPGFGTQGTGTIGIQGDHGNVSFRNIKVRVLK